MRAALVAVDAQREPIVSAVAAPRHATASPPDRNEEPRESGSEAQGDDRRQANARVGDGNGHDGGDHAQPANPFDLNMGHVDEGR